MADTILFLAHVEDGTLATPALEALGAAVDLRAGLGAALVVGLVGPGAAAAASAIGGCGAARWLAVEDPAFAEARYATDAAAAEALAARRGRRSSSRRARRAGCACCPAWRTGWAGAPTRT